jgi:hypothetical protein
VIRFGAAATSIVMLAGCTPPVWHAVSVDRAIHVTVQEQQSRSCVRVGSTDPRCHDAVSLPGMTLSSRGGSVAYPARVGAQWVVVHNGRPGPEWDGVGTPALNVDGSRVAYPAVAGSTWSVIVDGKPGAAFDAIVIGTLGFDSTGRHLGYVGRRGDSSFVVIDGRESRGWSAASRPLFFADGTHSAYVGWLNGRAHAVLDGVPQAPRDSIGGFAYAVARSVWAYTARDSNAWNVIAGSSLIGTYEQVRELSWPRAGKKALPVYIAKQDGVEAVFGAGVAPRWHKRVSSLAFDAEDRMWGYVADTGDVYINGERFAKEIAAADLTFSDDGSAFAYVAAREKSVEIVTGLGRTSFDLVVPGTLQFLSGTSTWTCLAGDQQRRDVFVVIDGKRTSHRIPWHELVRTSSLPDPVGTLRAMVAAEARLALGASK